MTTSSSSPAVAHLGAPPSSGSGPYHPHPPQHPQSASTQKNVSAHSQRHIRNSSRSSLHELPPPRPHPSAAPSTQPPSHLHHLYAAAPSHGALPSRSHHVRTSSSSSGALKQSSRPGEGVSMVQPLPATPKETIHQHQHSLQHQHHHPHPHQHQPHPHQHQHQRTHSRNPSTDHHIHHHHPHPHSHPHHHHHHHHHPTHPQYLQSHDHIHGMAPPPPNAHGQHSSHQHLNHGHSHSHDFGHHHLHHHHTQSGSQSNPRSYSGLNHGHSHPHGSHTNHALIAPPPSSSSSSSFALSHSRQDSLSSSSVSGQSRQGSLTTAAATEGNGGPIRVRNSSSSQPSSHPYHLAQHPQTSHSAATSKPARNQDISMSRPSSSLSHRDDHSGQQELVNALGHGSRIPLHPDGHFEEVNYGRSGPSMGLGRETRMGSTFYHGPVEVPPTHNRPQQPQKQPPQWSVMTMDEDEDEEDDGEIKPDAQRLPTPPKDRQRRSLSISSSRGGGGSSEKMTGSADKGTDQGYQQEVHKCTDCGKVYKHPNCLWKHRWEHSNYWKSATKFLLSKHQQVRMMEAAAILLGIDASREMDKDEIVSIVSRQRGQNADTTSPMTSTKSYSSSPPPQSDGPQTPRRRRQSTDTGAISGKGPQILNRLGHNQDADGAVIQNRPRDATVEAASIKSTSASACATTKSAMSSSSSTPPTLMADDESPPESEVEAEDERRSSAAAMISLGTEYHSGFGNVAEYGRPLQPNGPTAVVLNNMSVGLGMGMQVEVEMKP